MNAEYVAWRAKFYDPAFWRHCTGCGCWIVPDFDRPATDQRTICLGCEGKPVAA